MVSNLSNALPNRLRRGQGQGRGSRGVIDQVEDDVESTKATGDRIVQATNAHASISRMSAVDVGYLEDVFACEFAQPGAVRRFPIINRGTTPRKHFILILAGTYVRTRAIDKLVDGFLASFPGQKTQIISLGAGSDTRYFRLLNRNGPPDVLYHEIDFASNTQQKILRIKFSVALRQHIAALNASTSTETELHSSNYHIHALDLRHLESSQLPQIDSTLPTLLLSECCLIYLRPEEADAVVDHFTQIVFPNTTPLSLVLYEPINPFDAFGQVMVENLRTQNIVMQTLHKYGSLDLQRERLRTHGFTAGAEALNLLDVYEQWTEETEKKRVGKLEMLDEVEELNMLLKHYCVAWGWTEGYGGKWLGWKELSSKGSS